MEAPEKLYLSKNIYSTFLYQVPDPDDAMQAEYIRKDAFIEKAHDIKDVDLEREIETYMHIHNLYVKDGGRIVFKHNGEAPNYQCDFRDIAKYFYNLGLARKGK